MAPIPSTTPTKTRPSIDAPRDLPDDISERPPRSNAADRVADGPLALPRAAGACLPE